MDIQAKVQECYNVAALLKIQYPLLDSVAFEINDIDPTELTDFAREMNKSIDYSEVHKSMRVLMSNLLCNVWLRSTPVERSITYNPKS